MSREAMLDSSNILSLLYSIQRGLILYPHRELCDLLQFFHYTAYSLYYPQPLDCNAFSLSFTMNSLYDNYSLQWNL